MKKRKTTLSNKLLVAFLCLLLCISMVVLMIDAIVSDIFGDKAKVNMMYIVQLLVLLMIILAFYHIVDRIIVYRIIQLNNAMKDIANGNYDLVVSLESGDEISALADSFNKMTAELKANAFLSKDFARYVSHEFKTPLAVIRNYAELTQDMDKSSETVQNMDVIISEVDRLTGLSKDIMELCKLDSTTVVEKRDVFSPASQIRSMILDLQLLWGEKNIEMIPDLEEFEILSNEALLFRVWQNIIGNAIKFTEQDGCISVTLKKNSEDFTCEIADNGVGISDEDKEHLFTPFFSGNRFRNKEGNGLGLSLSKKIVEKLDGTITFKSEVGKGSVFTVTIPY